MTMIEAEVVANPRLPRGGHARINLPSGTLPRSETEIVVYNQFTERYLAPDGHWHAAPTAFGPYPVSSDGPQQTVDIGPEIVDHLEAYQPLRLSFGKIDADVSWPDTISASPGGATRGGIETVPRPAPDSGGGLSGTVGKPSVPPQPEPQPVPETGTDSDDEGAPVDPPAPEPETKDPDKGRKPWPIWLALAGAVAAVAIVAYVVLGDGEELATETPPEEVAEVDPCSTEALGAVEGDTSAFVDTLGACRDTLGSDGVLREIERAANAGDARALVVLGQLNDAARSDAGLEAALDLDFGNRPAIAADYYAQAISAGSAEAEAYLTDVCAQLEDGDAMAAIAFDDFCTD